MKNTFTDYIKGKFIETGEVNKDNFEDLYPEWLNQLEDEELDKFAYEWKEQEREMIEMELHKVFDDKKQVCTCPKGGMYADGKACPECEGTEYVLPKELRGIEKEVFKIINP